ncbi:hypothetical protein [Agromyces albus]|uniref:hypothetical protein n=1 Tax=Agromyces albus TaxID=205332 RepID=UPI0027820FC8|nr:hypothetical protein [Agromyces albus]MDQ0576857.1 putative small lipoprotein YifL [Agromyces albus]
MSRHARLGRHGVLALLMLSLMGCAGSVGPVETPPPPPTTTTTSPPTASPTSSPGDDEPRVLIECFYPDGSEVATFTRLEEAWASTNYVRIDHCEARAAEPDEFELSDEEAEVASVAEADLPGEDATELFLLTLAACVRLTPEGDRGMASRPTSILEAALVLCPEAPHAGLIETELGTRG